MPMDKNLYSELIGLLDEELLADRLREMIAIKSENPFNEEPRQGYREKEMGEYMREAMRSLGFEVRSKDVRPDRPNVFGFKKGLRDGPTLILCGHLDTARTDGYPDAYKVVEKAGRIFGRGACDMKAALAAYLEVGRLLKIAEVGLKGQLILAGVMDEEYQMLGSKDVGRHGPRADQGIIGEPSDLNVCPSNKGRVSTFIKTFGRAAHSSVPENGENAIIRMARVIMAFADYNDRLLRATPHPLCGHGRFNPGIIRGGVQVNTVPDSCEMEVDRRTLPGETKDEVYAEFRTRLDPLREDDPGFRYEITEPSWLIPPNDISPTEPVVLSLLAAYEAVFDKKNEVRAFVAGSDAPHMGCPTVICGPGSIVQAHSTNEFVAKEELINATKMYLWAVLDLLS
jgi:acetylornithine deacetylase/succinyl-diaminopimelate desuccinylase family protein